MTNKKMRGLGKGIGALFPSDSPLLQKDSVSEEASNLSNPSNQSIETEIKNSFEEKKEVASNDQKVSSLLLAEIRPNPYQPRTHFDQESLKELADSITQQGVLQPIIVRCSAIKGYEIIAGERRYRASKLAGLETIPSIICDMTDEQMIETAIIENLQREDLTPLEEAHAYKNLMSALHLTQAEAAQRLGKSRAHVANYVRLLDLSEEVKNYLQKGQLSMGQARTLLGVKNAKEQVKLAHKVVNEGITVRQLEKLVQNLNEPVQAAPKVKMIKEEKPKYLLIGEEHLMDKFGTNVQIKPKGQAGRIEIEYLSQEDLTRILDLLDIRFED